MLNEKGDCIYCGHCDRNCRGPADQKSYRRDAHWFNTGSDCGDADGKSRELKKII